MRAIELEFWWAWDSTIHLTIQPQVGSPHHYYYSVDLLAQLDLMPVYAKQA